MWKKYLGICTRRPGRPCPSSFPDQLLQVLLQTIDGAAHSMDHRVTCRHRSEVLQARLELHPFSNDQGDQFLSLAAKVSRVDAVERMSATQLGGAVLPVRQMLLHLANRGAGLASMYEAGMRRSLVQGRRR